jgi:hypothetical protein
MILLATLAAAWAGRDTHAGVQDAGNLNREARRGSR